MCERLIHLLQVKFPAEQTVKNCKELLNRNTKSPFYDAISPPLFTVTKCRWCSYCCLPPGGASRRSGVNSCCSIHLVQFPRARRPPPLRQFLHVGHVPHGEKLAAEYCEELAILWAPDSMTNTTARTPIDNEALAEDNLLSDSGF